MRTEQTPHVHPARVSMEYAAIIKKVEKRFGATFALRGVSFDLRKGELLGVLGPNGAGKTTLIRGIAGRVKLDHGSIEIGTAAALGSRRRAVSSVGLVPQELAIYPDLTAQQNLKVFGRLHGLRGSALKASVEWGLVWSGLQERRNELVRSFSGGMKRRVNLACGVLHNPHIVLLDEPTVGVDPQSRERIYEMIGQLRDGGTSFLLTTHHLEEAQGRCDRLVIMDHGRVVAVGMPSELVDGVFGYKRIIQFFLDRLPAAPNPDFVVDREKISISITVESIDELPLLITDLCTRGLKIKDIEIITPNLQDLFLHLTGRKLRE